MIDLSFLIRPVAAAALFCLAAGYHALAVTTPGVTVTDRPGNGAFPLVYDHAAADIHVEEKDFKVAHIAADCLAADIQAVTGIRPRISPALTGVSRNIVLVGTLGNSAPIDQLVRAGRLDVKEHRGEMGVLRNRDGSRSFPGSGLRAGDRRERPARHRLRCL